MALNAYKSKRCTTSYDLGAAVWGYIPGPVYRFLPALYIGGGLGTLLWLPNIYGIVSGALLITTGVQVLVWRNKKPRKERRRAAGGQSRKQARDAADLRYPSATHLSRDLLCPTPSPERSSLLMPEAFPDNRSEYTEREELGPFNDGDPVTSTLLCRFSPFRELDDSLRRMFDGDLTVSRRPRGASLIHRGSEEDITIYLIEGTLLLEAPDGKEFNLEAGTRRACLPVCMLRPHRYTVTAATDVAVIMPSQRLVSEVTRIVTKYKHSPSIHVSGHWLREVQSTAGQAH